MNTRTVSVNGLSFDASFDQNNIDELWLPLIEKWKQLAQQKQSRVIILLSAPPGAGKSTLLLLLEQLANQDSPRLLLQGIGMDGFHYHQEYLNSHYFQNTCLKQIKGAPETFDLTALKKAIQELLTKTEVNWPIYDRRIHDVIDQGVIVSAPIVVIEGNYLSLNEDKWDQLMAYADDTIFINADKEILKQRLIARKMAGGLSYQQAEEFYQNSDQKNIQRVCNHHLKCNIELLQDKHNVYHYK